MDLMGTASSTLAGHLALGGGGGKGFRYPFENCGRAEAATLHLLACFQGRSCGYGVKSLVQICPEHSARQCSGFGGLIRTLRFC